MSVSRQSPLARRLTACLLAGTAVLAMPGPGWTQMAPPSPPPAATLADPTARADPDMAKVLTALQGLGPKPIETLSPAEARRQPSAADAVQAVVKAENLSVDPRAGLSVSNARFADLGNLRLRYYTPETATKDSNLPVVVYFRGGGWVIATLDTYDASAAALARKTGAAVVSVDYPSGPEHKFPAAHEEAVEAYRYVLDHAKGWGYDASRIAIVGESAGGNLALNTAIAARDRNMTRPVAVVSIYPVAQTGMATASYVEDANAKPLNKAMMGWFIQNATNGGSDLSDPRLNLVAADLKDLPPLTIINAEIDPLRSDGAMLADAVRAAGGSVTHKLYGGVTHEFFGMDAVVAKARDAQDFAVSQLQAGFAKPSTVLEKPPAAPAR